MSRGATRRRALRIGGLAVGATAALLGPGTRRARASDVYVGLVAPASGVKPHTLARVEDAIRLHQKDNGKSIFFEFDGREVGLDIEDSGHDALRVMMAVDRMVDYGVEYIVSGDVYSRPAKAAEEKAKEHNKNCILACSRMKLTESSPHPFACQLLPDDSAWFRQLFGLLLADDLPAGPIALLSNEGGLDFYRSHLGDPLLVALQDTGRPVAFAPTDSNEQLRNAVLTVSNGQEPIALVLTIPEADLAARAIEGFPEARLVLDAPFDDPADLSALLSDRVETVDIVALASRSLPLSEPQSAFAEAIKTEYERDPGPIDFYAGLAAQVIARSLEVGVINDVSIDQNDSVAGFGVAFDDQGRNREATLSLFRARGGELELVRRASRG